MIYHKNEIKSSSNRAFGLLQYCGTLSKVFFVFALFISFQSFATQIDLVTNGNFSSNNNGFTSDYNYSGKNNGEIDIDDQPSSIDNSFYSFYDHTYGNSSGDMLVANGHTSTNKDVWKMNLSVQSGKTYTLTFWLRSAASGNLSQVGWKVGGVQQGAVVTANSTWQRVSVVYTATTTGSVTFAIMEFTQASSGNVFALDDVSIKTEIAATCSGIFYDTGGSSGNYSNNEDYTKTYCSGFGQKIQFDFTEFEVENKYDYLTIYDGSTTSAQLIKEYTNNKSPGTVSSSGNCLTFRFTSDNSRTDLGWKANISCITDTKCSSISSVVIKDLNGSSDINITSGATLYLGQLPANWNLDATSTGTVGSIKFEVSGATSQITIDNSSPYRMPATSTALNWGAGTYRIKVIQFSESDGKGNICDEKEFDLIIDACAITNLTAASNTPVCTGSNLNLTATGGGTGAVYAWTGPNSFTSSQQNPTISNVGTPVAGNYVVSVTNGGCSATASTVVTILTAPSVTVSKTNASCGLNDGAITFVFPDNTSRTNLQFSTNNGSSYSANVPDNSGTYTISGLGPATYNVWARWDNSECPVSLGSVTITRQSGTLTKSSNATICSGKSTVLTAALNNAVGTVTYSWSNGLGTGSSKTVSPTANITYSVTGTDSQGCTASATISVAVNSLPTPTVGSNSPACAGGTIYLTSSGGSSYAWTGPNSFTSSTQNPNISFATYARAGAYSVTVTNANACSATAAVNVVINSGLTVTAATSFNKICAGQTLDLSSSGANNYTWQGPNGFTSNSQNPSVANATISHGGTYTVTGSNLQGCTATATTSVNVVVNNPTAGNDSPKCMGSTINFTSSGGDDYSWAGPNGFTASIANPSIAAAGLNREGIYTVTVTIAGGCAKTATTELSLYSSPNISITDPIPACQYDNVQLQASGGTSYAWTGPNSFSSSSQNPYVNNITNAKTGTYSVTVTNASGCSATATTEITLSFPSLVVSSDTALCVGGTMSLSASGGVGYNWSGPNSFYSSAANFSLPNVTSLESGVYTVTVSNSLGCTATTGVNVNVLSTSAAITTIPSICTADSLKLEVPGWANYQWTGPNSFSSTQAKPSIPNATIAHSGVYSVTVNVAGCTTTATSSVTVRPLPAPIITSNQPVCLGGTLNLSSTAASSYTWKGPKGFTSGAQSPNINVTDSLVQGLYSVKVVSSYGCVDSTTHLVDVDVIYPKASNSGTACIGSNVLLSAQGGSSYSWTGPNGYTSNLQNATISNVTAARTGIYTVVVSSANGCTASATTAVLISIPSVSASSNSPVCVGATVSFTGSSSAQYSWVGPKGSLSNLQNPSIANAQLNDSGSYTYTVTDSVSCAASTSLNVQVNALPTVIMSSNGPKCQGQSLNLTGGGGTSYSWAGPNGFLSSAQNPIISNLAAAANGIYTLQVVNANACSSISTLNVQVNPSPVPTASATIKDICVGETLNLLGGGGGTYAWIGPASFTSTSQNPSRSTATTGMTGTYTVTVTSSPQGCSATATVRISVNTIPPAPLANDITRCEPGTLTLTASGCSGIYSWYSTTSSTTVLGTGATYTTPSLSTDRSYYVDCTEFTCPSSARKEVKIQILPVPTATASVSQQHCKGSTAKFTGGGTNVSSYSWQGPSGWTSASQSPNFLVTANSDAGTYTITTTRSNGCTATATTNLTVATNCDNICNSQYVIIPTNPSSCGSTTGQVYISATTSYQTSLDGVTWYRGSHTFTGLGVGNYFFYVKDYNTQNICKNVSNTLVSTTTSFFTGTQVTAASDCYAANGSIKLQGVNASDDVTWLATLKGTSVPVSSLVPSNTISDLTPGKYYVKVSRANEFCYGEKYVDVPNNGTSCINTNICDDTSFPNLFPNGDFGSGTAKNGPVYTDTQYGYSNYTCYAPWDGFYAITNNTDCDGNGHKAFQYTQATGWWDILLEDHTVGDTNGYMMVINAGYTPNIVVEKRINDLCPNTQYNFTAWMRNISPDSDIQPNAAFIIDGVIQATSGAVSGNQWQKVGFSFKTGNATTSALFALRNIAPGGFGNNWILDDIKVSKCPLLINLSGTTIACLGGDNETINASVQDPYQEHKFYKWEKSDDNGATWDQVTAVAQGTYTSGSMNVSVNLPTPIVSAISGRIYRIRLATTAATIDDPKCSIYSSLTQIIVPPIQINVTEDQVKCIGSGSINLLASPYGGNAPYTYQWNNGLPATASVSVNPSVTTDYIVTARDSSNCPVTDTIKVVVEDQPTLTVSIDEDSVCVGGITDITAHVTGGSGNFDFTWYSASDTTGTWTTLTGEKDSILIPNTSIARQIYYRVYVEDLTYDCNDALSNAVLFNVVDDPTFSIATDDITLCLGGVVELIPTINGGAGLVTYQWQSSSSGNAPWTDITGGDERNTIVPSGSVGKYYYRLFLDYNGNGCNAPPSDSVKVEILPNFDVDVSLLSNEVCLDGDVVLTADTTSGTGTVTYQWLRSTNGSTFTEVTDSTGKTFRPVTSAEGTLYYQVRATSSGAGCGTTTSDDAYVRVLPTFEVDIAVNNPLVCIGGAVELVADTTNGTGTITYQWLASTDDVNFTAISGAVNVNYVPNTASTGIKYYQVQATASGAGCGTVTSASVSVEVLPVFSVQVSSNAGIVCLGGTVTLTADTSNGLGTITYKWFESLDNSTFRLITGATDATLNVTTSTVGIKYYQVEATASGPGCGAVRSNVVAVEVIPAFEVDVNPSDNIVCLDGQVLLSADTTSGSGTVTFQWLSSTDGTSFSPIADSTNITLRPSTATEGLIYYQIQATASGAGCGTVTSENAAVTVLPIFDVDVIVDNAVVCIGGAVQLEADTINGTGNVTYQWLMSTNNSTFTPISGATDSIYTPNTSSEGIIYYQVQATASGSGCGTVTSASVPVQVLPVFSVEVTSANNTVCLGGTVQLVADTTNGTGTVTYQWFESSDNISFSPLSGETNANLTANTSAVGIMYYRIEATASGSGCGTVTSNSALVEVLPVFEVEVSLMSNTVCIGGAVELFADTTSGTGTITYQWFESTNNSTFTPITNETDSTYTPNTSAVGSLYYRVQATASGAGCGTATSDNATVTVLPIFDVEVSVDNDVVCIGGVVQLEADTINGTGTVTYQWLSAIDNSTFTPISGATDSIYIPNTSTEGVIYYQVQATASGSGCGTVTSASTQVRVLPIFSVDIVLANNTVCLGGAVTLKADTTNGTGTVTYRWFESTNNSTFTEISGETDSTLSVNTSAVGSKYYQVEATASGSGCGTVRSTSAVVEVLPIFTVEVAVDDDVVCLDGLVEIMADTTSGTGTVTYQWFSSTDGSSFTAIADSTAKKLYPSTSTVGTLYYRIEATASGAGCGTASSDIASVAVLPQLSIDVNPSAFEICIGESVVLEGNPENGVGNISYQWQQFNGVTWLNISAEIDSVYSPATNVSGRFQYRINAFADGVGCTDASSAPAVLTINEYPDVTVSSTNPLCVPNNGQIQFSFSNEPYQDSLLLSLDGGITYPYVTFDSLGSWSIDTLSAGTYSIFAKWGDNSCPVDLGTVVLEDRASPAAIVSYVDPTCTVDNGQITFTFSDESTRTQLEFSLDGGSTYQPAVNDNLGAVTYSNLAPANYDLWVRWENNECPVDLADVELVDHPGPVLTVSADTTICVGATAFLSASSTGGDAPITFTWDNGLPNGSSNSVSPISTTTYMVTATDSNGCTTDETILVTVNPLPVITLSGGEYCEGDTIHLTASGGVSFDWTGPNSFTSNTQNPNIANGAPIHNGYYTVLVTDANACQNTDSVDVLVNPAPEAPTVTDAFQCGPGVLTLTASGCSGVTTWFDNQFSNNVVGLGTTFETKSLVATSHYFANCTSASNCVSFDRSMALAEIREASNAEVLPVNSTCVGEVALNNGILIASGFREGEMYSFSEGTTFNAASAIPATPTLIPTNGRMYETINNPSGVTTYYTVRIISTDGCPIDQTVEFERQCEDCLPFCEPATINRVK